MSEQKEIFIYAQGYDLDDFHKVTYELLGAAYDLAKSAKEKFNADFKINALAVNAKKDNFYKLFSAGAQKIYNIKHEKLKSYNSDYFTYSIKELVNKINPSIFLIGATCQGRDFAPKVSAELNTGLTADCTKLEIIESKGELKLASTRPTFGGQLMATILAKTSPQMATIRPGVMKPIELQQFQGEIEEFYPDLEEINSCANIVEYIKNIQNNCSNLETAKIVVAGGKGLKTKENFEKLEKLARLLNAASAASRAAVDASLSTQDKQVGQTGKTISPDIYVAFGISGAIHHISGMSNSKTVIAVNNDPKAPIFEHCDYKIVADAPSVIDELIEKLS